MSKKNISRNEPADRTVDEKLEKWRQKSIELEKQRQQEEEERKKQGTWNRFCDFIRKQPWVAAVGAAALIILVVVICIGVFLSGKINPAKYISIQYTGANGYAAAECVVDQDKLYEKLAGREKNAEKLTQYRAFADSMRAEVIEKDIANKDKITVVVSYDEQIAGDAGIVLSKTQYRIKASGIEQGNKIDLFSQVEIVFAGVSPEASVIISNRWEEPYLDTLTFHADKTENIVKGDTVTITCDVDAEELARHGYVVSTTAASVTAERLSVYAEGAEQLDKTVISEIGEEIFDTIVSQTEDTTFRMLYKATKNQDYLRSDNEETASDIELMNVYFLKRKDGAEGEKDNYLAFLCKAVIANADTEEEVYFLFTYFNGYVTAEGKYDIIHDETEKRYICSSDYESIYDEGIADKEETYHIVTVQ